ncbi:MAG TPA: pantetheine-phosphate adenylyltransferase [Candidatus Gastranaerophilaceae bacterium]|nr:pantetheine-phosphate adenylyltransferase [Candidatus Gastranaerophilaceae bacterium]HPT41464.1 pantetheine-phosphate adenylyltransferase [Candidatus Gastranaerophilaceae bacterium]
MTIAVYPGSFDPITNGHLDVLKTASEIFEKVIIAVSKNSEKKSLFTFEQRLDLIKKSINGLNNVEVDSFDGLTVEYAKSKGAKVIIRGLRAVSDFEFEMQLSQTNRSLAGDIKTVFLTTRPKYNFISSSTVKEIARMHGDVSKFVTEPVEEFLKLRFAK